MSLGNEAGADRSADQAGGSNNENSHRTPISGSHEIVAVLFGAYLRHIVDVFPALRKHTYFGQLLRVDDGPRHSILIPVLMNETKDLRADQLASLGLNERHQEFDAFLDALGKIRSRIDEVVAVRVEIFRQFFIKVGKKAH
ncbi:hypothetical protein [Mesorhizobium sp.]|uniref:hypothetical protein n=1 Tax=Mesorhizobium sp. TaxID=1871066 RepID=UPI0025828DEA|nr:hypothetical protein [Mesorhizobium sp.]